MCICVVCTALYINKRSSGLEEEYHQIHSKIFGDNFSPSPSPPAASSPSLYFMFSNFLQKGDAIFTILKKIWLVDGLKW
jgi:hypothetical protein